jgi:hypothetical protein
VDDGCGKEEYIRQVLEAYRKTPGTMGITRRPDRMLAAQLYQRGVSVAIVENALVLAAARRLMRPTDAPPLSTILHWLISFQQSRKCSAYTSAPITSNTCAANSNASLQLDSSPERLPHTNARPWRGCRETTRTPAAWMILLVTLNLPPLTPAAWMRSYLRPAIAFSQWVTLSEH